MKKALSLLLTVIISICLLPGCSVRTSQSSYQYSNMTDYKAGDFKYDPKPIKSVSIDWFRGKLDIIQGSADSEKLKVDEKAPDLSKNSRVHCRVSKDQLLIKYCASGYSTAAVSNLKHLIVEIPADVELNIYGGGADININGCSITELNCESTTGSVNVDDCTAEKLKIKTTVGGVKINLHDKKDADLKYSTVSGKLNADGYEKTGTKNNYKKGNGDCKIFVETLTGSLEIK